MKGRRGQTEFDYLVGMALLLLTVSAVFLFVPSVFEPFEQEVSADERASADRMATNLLSKSTVDGQSNTVDYDRFELLVRGEFDTVLDRAAVPTGRTVNVTLENDTGIVVGNGTSYADNRDPAATTVRVVRLADDGDTRCNPVCRLVVRVW